MDQFLAMWEMHFINHNDDLVRAFLQNWFRSLLTGSITCFDDLKDMFLTQYTHPIVYHTLLTQFTRIHLEKGERIRDFNLSYFRTVQWIPECQCINDSMILICYKNFIPSNVNYALEASRINTLKQFMRKAYEMEEDMFESNIDHDIIIGWVKIHMDSLSISVQRPST